MTRDAFKTLLTDAIGRGSITLEQGRDLLRRFDVGEIDADAVPLAEAEAVSEDDLTLSLAKIAEIIGITSLTILIAELTRLGDYNRGRIREALQDAFVGRVTRAARAFERGASLRGAWQPIMQRAISQHILAQWMLGAGRTPSQNELQALQTTIQTQHAYLARFAADVALHALTGQPMSAALIASRSVQYGGAGRAAYFQGYEVRPLSGYIVRYVAKDDDRTCEACIRAEQESPFLVGVGKYPGQVCEGRGYCRCERRVEYNPQVAAQLAGGARP